jgi:hypothetical protein
VSRVEILPRDAGDETILAAVRRWIGLLAADDVEAAVEFLYQGEGAGSLAASASSLRACIARYEPGAPLRQEPARVTPAETAGGPLEPLAEVFRRDDGTVTSVDFSLPVNGEWSELVAFFDVVTVPGGLALALGDAYVA